MGNVEQAKLFPVATVLFFDIEIGELDIVGRCYQLDITTGAEGNFLAFRQLQVQLFDEGRYIGVGRYFGFPLLHAEDFFRHFNFHILLHRNLAGESPALFLLAHGEVRLFGRQDRTAALFYPAFALGTRATATTGRRKENTVGRQGVQKLAAGLGLQGVLRVAVDFNGHVPATH